MLPQFSQLAKKYSNKIDMVLVYILEAHANDEWPIANVPTPLPVNQHICLKDRMYSAQLLKNLYGEYIDPSIKILLDTMNNSFNKTYSSWPFRCWIIDSNCTIAWKGMPTDDGDNLTIDEVVSWLERNVSTENQD